MKIGIINGDKIILWHFQAEEIEGLESIPHIVVLDDFVPDPSKDYWFRSGKIESTDKEFEQPDPTPEERITALETENAALKATLDDMILNSPIPAMQAAIDELILTGGGL